MLRETNRKLLDEIQQMVIDMESVKNLNKEYFTEILRLERIVKDNTNIRHQVNIFNF